jgi:hypothetical protein
MNYAREATLPQIARPSTDRTYFPVFSDQSSKKKIKEKLLKTK